MATLKENFWVKLILHLVYWPAAGASLFLVFTFLFCHGDDCQTAIPKIFLGLLFVAGSIALFVRSTSFRWRGVALLMVVLPPMAFVWLISSYFDIPGGVRRTMEERSRRDAAGNQSYFPRGPLRDMGAAIALSDVAGVNRLAPKVDINAHDEHGETFLDFAVNKALGKPPKPEALEVLRALLKAGADPNLMGRDLPIYQAIESAPEYGLEPMQILLAAGADPNKECRERVPAYFVAAYGGTAEVFQILVDHGADLRLQPKDDYLLIRTLNGPNWEVMLFLLQHGVDWTKPTDPLGRPFQELVKVEMAKAEKTKPPPPHYQEVAAFLRTHPAPKH
jgi:hypothetical protein